MVKKEDYIWLPHAAHFIMGSNCEFHLATKVGKYIVSTVGEYWPEESIREIYATSRGIKLVGQGDARRADYYRKLGYEEVGFGRKYETMVFTARKSRDTECRACPWKIESG